MSESGGGWGGWGEPWSAGWGQLGIQRAGTAPKPDLCGGVASGGWGGDRTFAFPNFSKVPHVQFPPSPRSFSTQTPKFFKPQKC